jgi:hypothetical protein
MGERLGFITPGIFSGIDSKELFRSVNGTAKRLIEKNKAKKKRSFFKDRAN